jgi:hypothetical protein
VEWDYVTLLLPLVRAVVDGAQNNKFNDFGVAVKGGSDGNAYIAGYSLRPHTEDNDAVPSTVLEVPILIVVSPTGKTLFRQEIEMPAQLLYQKVVDMELVEQNSSTRSILIVGESKEKNNPEAAAKLSTSVVTLLEGAIQPFDGFDGTVDSASAGNHVPVQSNVSEGNTKMAIGLIAGGAIGGLAVVIAVAGLAAHQVRVRKQQRSRERPAFT